jgi:NitT/TauT family transport system ATP-binding protein
MTADRPALLDVAHLHHEFNASVPPVVALDDLTLQVGQGEFVSVVGPSGAGKTTLLRCLSGLTRPTTGEIRLDGRLVTDVPEELAIVFQDYSRSLFAWLTVESNVDMPLRRLGLDRAERRSRIVSSLGEVGLEDSARQYPWQLSGGMQQRVAIARALAYHPSILLMDEPFASVDAQTRADLQDMLLDVWLRHESTIVFVTHDIDESVYLADRIVVLSKPPTRVLSEIPVDLPRPRDQIATRELRRYSELRTEVARLIRRPTPEATADSATDVNPG